MNKPKSKARHVLEVTIMFEPTRLAARHLADAYTQVVPLRARGRRPLPDVEVESAVPTPQRRPS